MTNKSSCIKKTKYLVFGVTHLNNILAGDAVGVVKKTVNSVRDSTHSNWNTKSQNIDGGWADQMVLLEQELISSVSDQVCLESQTERNVQGDVSAD